MEISNDISLRPRFVLLLEGTSDDILNAFQTAKKNQNEIQVTCVDDHVFLKFPRAKQELFTPQLQLELIPQDSEPHQLHGLVGPSPALWTMFMFFHFVIAVCFLAFGVWLYTNIRTQQTIAIPIFLMLLMVLFWFGLYAIGRIGRRSGLGETQTLINFLQNTLKSSGIRYKLKT